MVTIDLHAPQIQGFFKIPTDDLSIVSMFGQYFRAKCADNEITNDVINREIKKLGEEIEKRHANSIKHKGEKIISSNK